ncbi:MAG: tRNA-binding protein [Flavobacteriales bacterium]|nr:tRNA-binding protein [Flavobacteriales bacterium]
MNPISWDDFEKVEMHIGTIVEVMEFPEARKPAYKLIIDFGPEIGQRKSSAQITQHYTPGTLIGRQVVAVTNFSPKQIGPWISECLVLGAVRADQSVILLSPEQNTSDGLRIA